MQACVKVATRHGLVVPGPTRVRRGRLSTSGKPDAPSKRLPPTAQPAFSRSAAAAKPAAGSTKGVAAGTCSRIRLA